METLWVPDHIATLVPYVPGKPISEIKRELKIKRVIKLASNENPWGPSSHAKAAVRKSMRDLFRYPDPAAYALKQSIAKFYQLSPAQLVMGSGSVEIIPLLMRAFTVPGQGVSFPEFSFIAYATYAQMHNLTIQKLPVAMGAPETDLTLWENQLTMPDSVTGKKPRLAFLANPNNPTGSEVALPKLMHFLTRVFQKNSDLLFVLDDAYGEYLPASQQLSPAALVDEFPRLIILKTFSKAYALSSLRVGYSISSPEVAGLLNRVREPFNVSQSGLDAALAALKDQAYLKKCLARNQVEHQKITEYFLKRGVHFLNSRTNFFLVNARQSWGRGGLDFTRACLSRGLILRPVDNYGLQDYFRMSIGSESENKAAMRIMDAVMKEHENVG